MLLGLDLGGDGAALLGGLMVVLASLGYAIGGFIVKNKLTGIAPLGMSATVLGVRHRGPAAGRDHRRARFVPRRRARSPRSPPSA